MSTWLEASTGTLVSCETSTGSSLTLRRRAYSLARIQAGPDQASPPVPVVFSASQGRLASTPTFSTPAFRMASMRGLAPAAGGSCASAGEKAAPRASSPAAMERSLRMMSCSS